MLRKRTISLLLLSVLLLLPSCRAESIHAPFQEDITALTLPDDVRIIALGEGTHGTSEFYQFKLEIFQHLYENYGVRVFILEAGAGECAIANEYVQGAPGTAEAAAYATGFAIYATEEMADILEWMREVNAGGGDILFAGCDIQSGPATAICLLSYANKLPANLNDSLTQLLLNATDIQHFASDTLKIEWAKENIPLAQQAYDLLVENREICITHMSEQQFEEMLFFADNLIDCLQYAYTGSFDFRDACMAENVTWWMEHTGEDKVFLTAHNTHVFKNSVGVAGNITVMGEHLYNTYGEQYFIIGTHFYHANVTAGDELTHTFEVYEVTCDRGKLISAFVKTGLPQALLDFGTVETDDPIWHLLRQKDYISALPHTFSTGLTRFPGAFCTVTVPDEACDALIFVRDAHPTTVLSNQ